MAQSTFDEQGAKKWIEKVNGYNSEADSLLKKVSECIEDIRSESEGPMVEALTQVASNLSSRFAELVSALGNLVVALKDVIDKFRRMAEDTVNAIKDAAKSMVGGIDVSITI